MNVLEESTLEKIYYHPEHLWTGREAIDLLQAKSKLSRKKVLEYLSQQAFWQCHYETIIDPENGCYKSHHKTKYGKALETELFRWHHKNKYQMGIEDDLIPVAWHPSRFWDWCMAEEDKKTAEQLWN